MFRKIVFIFSGITSRFCRRRKKGLLEVCKWCHRCTSKQHLNNIWKKRSRSQPDGLTSQVLKIARIEGDTYVYRLLSVIQSTRKLRLLISFKSQRVSSANERHRPPYTIEQDNYVTRGHLKLTQTFSLNQVLISIAFRGGILLCVFSLIFFTMCTILHNILAGLSQTKWIKVVNNIDGLGKMMSAKHKVFQEFLNIIIAAQKKKWTEKNKSMWFKPKSNSLSETNGIS